MKRRIIIPMMLMMASVLSYGQKNTDDFSGKWKTPEGRIVLITRSGNAFTGITQEAKEKIIENVQFTEGHWRGTILKPGTSTKASCELTIDEDKLTIVAKKSVFTKTITWTKLQ